MSVFDPRKKNNYLFGFDVVPQKTKKKKIGGKENAKVTISFYIFFRLEFVDFGGNQIG